MDTNPINQRYNLLVLAQLEIHEDEEDNKNLVRKMK
jgi:hypothetical protein